MINVWQTLDLIAGNDLKRRIDGFQDGNNVFKAISKRDSFSRDLQCNQRVASTEDSTEFPADTKQTIPASGKKTASKGKSRGAGRGKGRRKSEKGSKKKLNNQEGGLPEEYDAVIDCSFNVPRISARLERLMGTNVVRLTDRKYMKELRTRLHEDYILMLNKRIEQRAIKELERERNLILDGKTDIIPDELANHPIFIVNKRVNKLIARRRAKMKTNREKNAEKLLRQGAKWERDRVIYDELDRQKDEEIRKLIEAQKKLEEQYRQEDAKLGLGLLRMHDKEYKDCEKSLKEFLDRERRKMKAKSMRKPHQFISDPLDVVNIVQKRRKFRDTERNIRQQLDEKYKDVTKTPRGKEILARAAATSEMSRKIAEEVTNDKPRTSIEWQQSDEELTFPEVEKYSPTHTDSKYLKMLQSRIDEDVTKGVLVSKTQYDEMHYSDPRVARLKLADNINDLYLLAEEIITGEPHLEGEEGGLEEEEEDEH